MADRLTRQARQIAEQSAPSKKLINRQYQRSINDVGGFGQALLAALRAAGGQAGAAYSGAVDQQQGIDQAAQDRLAGLGPGYAGAAVATGAAGDSALARLTDLQAASGKYEAQLPAIGASRTALAQTGLASARKDALLQREDAIAQQVPGIRGQLASQQFSQRLALENLGLSQQRLAQSAAYQQATLGLRAEGLRQSGARLGQEEQHWQADFIAKYGFDPYSGKKVRLPGGGSVNPGKSLGLTTSQFYGYRNTASTMLSPITTPKKIPLYGQKDANGNVVPSSVSVGVKPSGSGWQIVGYRTYQPKDGWAQQGKSFTKAIDDLISAGVPRPIALWAAIRNYRQFQSAQPGTPEYAAYQSYFNFITQGQQAAKPTYNGPH